MPRFEQNPQQSGNMELNKSNFLEAVHEAHVESIETDFDERAVEALGADLTSGNIFLLGELHGAKENPSIIYTLFKKFGFNQLGLEWHPSLTKGITDYLDNGFLDFSAIEESADGRITAGHFALLRKLRDEGMISGVLCFDEGDPSGSWDGRDANMAKNILAGRKNGRMLVVAGNLHTNTEPITLGESAEKHHPMGERVREQMPNAPAGKVRYLRGVFFNFGVKDASEDSESTSTKARFYRDGSEYVFELPEAHAAAVPNPSEILPD